MSKKTNEMMTVKVRVESPWCDPEPEVYSNVPIKGEYPALEWLCLHYRDFNGLYPISDGIVVCCYRDGEKDFFDAVNILRLKTGDEFCIYDRSRKKRCMVTDKSWDSHIEYVVIAGFEAGKTGSIDPLLAALYRKREELEY